MGAAPRIAPVFLAAALCYSPSPAEQGHEPVEAKLVTLNVVALDNHGQPVRDLTADDFKIVDHGKPQKISFFRSNEQAAKKLDQPLEPHEFSNRRGTNLSHVTVIVFDVLNAPLAEQGYSRNQVIKTLQQLESGEYLYFYLLTVNGLYPVRALPDGETDPSGAAWTRNVKQLLDGALNKVMQMNPGLLPEDRVATTFLSLEGLAGRMAAIPGRKNVVWITRGVPISVGPARSSTGEVLDYEPMIHNFSTMLDRAKIAVYPVDSMISSTSSLSSMPDISQAGPVAAPGRGTDPTSRNGGLGSMDTLTQIAGLTGGRASFSNDSAAAIKQALEDARFSYMLGYDPSDNNWDGKYHKIQVTCTRRGVKIQTKQGYFATPPLTLENGLEQAAVESASVSPFDGTEIGLRVKVTPSDKVARGIHLQTRIDSNDILLQRSGGNDATKYSGQLSVTLIQYDSSGRMFTSPTAGYKMQLTPEQRERALATAFDIGRDWKVEDNITKVRLIVFDAGSKSIGSVTLPLADGDRSPAR